MQNSIEKQSHEQILDTRGAGHDEKSFKAKALITTRRIIAYTILILLSLMCLFTIYILIINATRSTSEIQTGFSFIPGTHFGDNWNSLFSGNLPVLKGFLNSFIISFLSATLCAYFSALTAYGIHMYNFKLKRIAFMFILLVMMVPSQVGAIGLVKMCNDLGFTTSNNPILVYMPLILPSVASPIVFFYMKQYLESILPKEMVEAARVDGAGEMRIFHGMVLPILKPALAIQFIFAFVSSWNNYFVPQLLLANKGNDYKTIPLVLAVLNDQSNPEAFDLGKVYMVMLLAIVPLLIVYLIFSKFILKNLTSGSVKG
ncbi:MAG: carbohydrate ABC transporter permease [Acholeplasmatales bacterium]|nr:carbohydrate ABC transporter permease [Acholeplasmatales bacterium]